MVILLCIQALVNYGWSMFISQMVFWFSSPITYSLEMDTCTFLEIMKEDYV